MEGLAQLETLCERLYNSQDPAERSHAERALQVFSSSAEYITQCQLILDTSSSPYAQHFASHSLVKQTTDQNLSVQLRLDIRTHPSFPRSLVFPGSSGSHAFGISSGLASWAGLVGADHNVKSVAETVAETVAVNRHLNFPRTVPGLAADPVLSFFPRLVSFRGFAVLPVFMRLVHGFCLCLTRPGGVCLRGVCGAQ